MRTFFSTFLVFILAIGTAFSQQISLSVDTTAAKVGAPIAVSIEVESPQKIEWPTWEKEISGLELLRSSKVNEVQNGQKYRYSQTLYVTHFEKGDYNFGPIEITAGNAQLVSQRLSLKFSSYNVPSEELLQTMSDLNSPIEVLYETEEEETLTNMNIGIMVLVFILVVGGLILYLGRKRNRETKVEVKREKLDAVQIANNALERLKQEQLWQQGEVKQYYIRLTDIFRVYLENHLKMEALESTTDEIIVLMKEKDIYQTQIDRMAEVLQTADLVKFAKYIPEAHVNDRFLADVSEFIQITKITILKEEEEGADGIN